MNIQNPKELPLEQGTFLEGDVLARLAQLADDHFQLVITSPPYNIGKPYERGTRLTLSEYARWQKAVCREVVRCLAPGGSVCWQSGNYVKAGVLTPLDYLFYRIFTRLGLKLRNRIIWRFNFGLNAERRFSGRYETVLWFTKGEEYKFNLDPVRIPQLYPGKRYPSSKGDKAGKLSGNPLGKNPSDCWEFSASEHFVENPVWEIPNVKAKHPERTEHPCQFPVELVERCVLALTDPGDRVLDPFVGTGASIVAALKNGRNGVGIDKDGGYLQTARLRVIRLQADELPLRPMGRPLAKPDQASKVARMPDEWLGARGATDANFAGGGYGASEEKEEG